GHTRRVVNEPRHPYTRALLAAIPEPDPDLTRKKTEIGLRSADIPSLYELPAGCAFHPRCPFMEEGLCDVDRPELLDIGDARLAACHVVAREHAMSVESTS